MVESMLTTVDNPYDPFTQFDAWYAFDTQAGYNTAGFLARIIVTSEDLPQPSQDLAMELAIDEIIAENVTGLYRRATREVPDIL